MAYRTLGRTGIRVSEIGFGGYPIRDAAVIDHAIDRGINYLDTARGYRGGASEETIGKVLARRRAEVVVTTKYRWRSHVKKEQMLADIDGSLKRLRTDHVDFVLVHQVGKASDGEGVLRLDNPELHEAFDRARQAGKVRHLGCSGHDGDLMEVMEHAIESGRFDLLLMRYSFLDFPQQAELIRKAKARGIAVVAMKTLAGAKGWDVSEFRDRHGSFKLAALRWVLSNPDVSNLIVSIQSRAQVDEYASASGSPLTRGDASLLEEYAARFGSGYCRMCNGCEPACPASVRIADVLRSAMYYHDYRERAHGRAAFREIPAGGRNLAACAGCAHPCAAACEHGVDVRALLARARGTFASA